jgi:hypothetical protein
MSRAATMASTLAIVLVLPFQAGSAAPAPHRADEIDWQTSPLDLDLRGMNGERYTFRCPPGKPRPSHVNGSGPYTDDSSICTAAVHAGMLRAGSGGDVAIEIRPGQSAYTGSERNYIRSGDYGSAWSGSFIVLPPADGSSPSPGKGDSHVRP